MRLRRGPPMKHRAATRELSSSPPYPSGFRSSGWARTPDMTPCRGRRLPIVLWCSARATCQAASASRGYSANPRKWSKFPIERAMRRPFKVVYEYFALYSSLALLGIICLTWSVFALPLYFILPKRAGTAVGRFGIMAGFRIYSWSLSVTGTYRLDLRAVDTLRGGPPVILAPNHPALIDALLILTRHPNLVCVMKAELLGNVFLGAGSRLARYIPSDQPRQMIKEAVAHLRRGSVLLLFPEGTRSTQQPVNRLTASVGVIAKHARVPVQV